MKRVMSFVLAMILMAAVCAGLAESAPSKSTGDLTDIQAAAENAPEDSDFFVLPVNEENSQDYQEMLDVCQGEIEKMIASETVEDYFGETLDSEGTPIDLKEALGLETLNVTEFFPLVAGNYLEEYGKITLNLLVATPYEVDEQVMVLIGIVTTSEEGENTTQWTAFYGNGVESASDSVELAGCVQVELTPEIMLQIQENAALLAIVSK